MKKIVFAICFALLLVGCNKYSSDNIISFKYNFSDGNGDYTTYSIKYSDNKYIFDYEIKKDGVVNAKVKQIKKSDVKKIEKIINDYEIDKWNGFAEEYNSLVPGYSFSLEVNYESGETILARGYIATPDNYKKGHNELVKVLNTFVD